MTGVRQFSADELVTTQFPDLKWAVPGIVPEGLSLLVGPPKVGKSWLALDLCVSVAQGGRALDSIDVRKGDVLYLALEDTPRRMSHRLRRRLGTDPAPKGLDIQLDWENIEQVKEWLEDHPDSRLVVVDVLARVRDESLSENRYDSDYQALRPMKELADLFSVAIVVVHHDRKARAEDWVHQVSGTNGLAGVADAILMLKRSRGADDARLLVTGRDVEEDEHAMRFDVLRGHWSMEDGPASDFDVSGSQRSILRVLREEPGLMPKAIAERTNISRETVRQLVRKMAKAGDLSTDGTGRYSVHSVHNEAVTSTNGKEPFTGEGPAFTAQQLPVNAVNGVNGVRL